MYANFYAHMPLTPLLSMQWPEVEAFSFKTAAPSRPCGTVHCHPKLIYLFFHSPTKLLLFQKDVSPFAAFDLHTDCSLFPEFTCQVVPGSRHHLATSVMAHRRWSPHPLPLAQLLASFCHSRSLSFDFFPSSLPSGSCYHPFL